MFESESAFDQRAHHIPGLYFLLPLCLRPTPNRLQHLNCTLKLRPTLVIANEYPESAIENV